MRISDWSSDVCSSDLCMPDQPFKHHRPVDRHDDPLLERAGLIRVDPRERRAILRPLQVSDRFSTRKLGDDLALVVEDLRFQATFCHETAKARSEEHTSELQSLMRISYAVFRLQNNKRATRRTAPIVSPPKIKLTSV